MEATTTLTTFFDGTSITIARWIAVSLLITAAVVYRSLFLCILCIFYFFTPDLMFINNSFQDHEQTATDELIKLLELIESIFPLMFWLITNVIIFTTFIILLARFFGTTEYTSKKL
jgi:hypothetical protein